MNPVFAPTRDTIGPLSERRTSLLLAAQSSTRCADFADDLRKLREDRPGGVESDGDGNSGWAGVERGALTTPAEKESVGDKPAAEADGGDDPATAASDASGTDGPSRQTKSEPGKTDAGEVADQTAGGAGATGTADRPVPAAAPERPVTIRLLNNQILQGTFQFRPESPDSFARSATKQPDESHGSGGRAGAERTSRPSGARQSVVVDQSPGSQTQAADGGERGSSVGRETAMRDEQPSPHGAGTRSEQEAGPGSGGDRRQIEGRTDAAGSASRESPAAQAKAATSLVGAPGAVQASQTGPGSRARTDSTGAAPTDAGGGGEGGRGGQPVVIAHGEVGGRGTDSTNGGKAGRTASAARQSGETADGRNEFKTQLVRGLSAAIAQARGSRAESTSEVVLRLQPAALGQLRIRVAFDRERSGVSARFEVTSAEARKAVDGSLGHLRASLEARGMAIDGLEVVRLPRERPLGDPLGLATGTPYARADFNHQPGHAPGSVDPDGGGGGRHPGVGGNGSGGASEQPGGGTQQHSFDLHRNGHHGPEARPDRGQGSTDAPRPPSFFDDAAAERPIYLDSTRLPFQIGQNEGGALRLTIDALA